MLLQTNSYVVPRDRRMEHARILRRFRQTLLRLGCDHFEVYEQVGPNWSSGETNGRFVQIMRFRDRKHQLAVQQAERSDPTAQVLLREFCELINLPYQQQQGLFAVGYYTSFLRMPPAQQLEHAGVGEHSDAATEQSAVEEHPPVDEHTQAEEHAEGEASAESSAPAAEEETPSKETSEGGSAPEAAAEPEQSEAERNGEAAAEEHEAGDSPAPLEAGGSQSESAHNAEGEPGEEKVAEEESALDSHLISHEASAPADGSDGETPSDVEREISSGEIPSESETLDSRSVFLGSAEGDLDDPASIRQLPVEDDAEADTEKPTSPFNS